MAVAVTSVPPISSTVTTSSPSTVATPDERASKSVSPVIPIFPPSTRRSPAKVEYDDDGVEFPVIVTNVSSYIPLEEWSPAIVKTPLSDCTSNPSPTSLALSETNSNLEAPFDELEFFNTNAPEAISVVNRKSPSVWFDIVSPFPKVISFPVTVRSPLSDVVFAVIAIVLSVWFDIVSLFPKERSFPEIVKSPLIKVVGAAISRVLSALISNWPSVEEFIFKSESLKEIAFPPVNVPMVLAVMPVRFEPSPTNAVAVTVPVLGL